MLYYIIYVCSWTHFVFQVNGELCPNPLSGNVYDFKCSLFKDDNFLALYLYMYTRLEDLGIIINLPGAFT